MITFISCAKTMSDNRGAEIPVRTLPFFQDIAERNALALSQYRPDELQQILKINSKLAAENYMRYHDFLSEENVPVPALLAYTGIVFKHIEPENFSDADWIYAQKHLLISSFLYGLLRPGDVIKNYRLEGNVTLDINDGKNMFDFWKTHLTDYFISLIKENGGLLFNLASSEMKSLFDWKKVCKMVKVVTPEFYVEKNGKLKTVVVYSKMCRGEMTKYIIRNRIESCKDLESFEWDGFKFDEKNSSDNKLVFVL